MTSARVTALVLGGALLTSWLVAAGTSRQSPAIPPVPPAPRPADARTRPADLQVQAERLRAYVARAPAPRESSRNPFAFAPHAPRRAMSAAQEVVTPANAPSRPPTPVIRLVGIATDGGARMAALSVGGTVVLARVGDVVADRYRVTAVTDDVVELEDRAGGPLLRLGLR